MKIITLILIALTCSSTHAFLGQSVNDVKAVYGEPRSATEYPTGTYYTFTNSTSSLAFSEKGGKVLGFRLEYTGDDRQGFIDEHLGDIHSGWSTQIVSSAEFSIFSLSTNHPGCIKLRNDQKQQTVYIGTDSYNTNALCLRVVTDEFLIKEATNRKNKNERLKLNYGYLAGLNSTLDNFFEEWHKKYPAHKRSKFKYPEIIESSYEIFERFYLESNLVKIAPEISKDLPNYLVFPDTISITQHVKSIPEGYRYDDRERPILDLVINEFRPNVKLKGSKAVFLTDRYKDTLEEFLGNEEYPFAYGGIMNPARARGESLKRLHYINQMTRVMHGHWGGWLLTSHPSISHIEFNRNISKAKVHFRVGYRGGEASFTKEKDNWLMESCQMTWIE